MWHQSHFGDSAFWIIILNDVKAEPSFSAVCIGFVYLNFGMNNWGHCLWFGLVLRDGTSSAIQLKELHQVNVCKTILRQNIYMKIHISCQLPQRARLLFCSFMESYLLLRFGKMTTRNSSRGVSKAASSFVEWGTRAVWCFEVT